MRSFDVSSGAYPSCVLYGGGRGCKTSTRSICVRTMITGVYVSGIWLLSKFRTWPSVLFSTKTGRSDKSGLINSRATLLLVCAIFPSSNKFRLDRSTSLVINSGFNGHTIPNEILTSSWSTASSNAQSCLRTALSIFVSICVRIW